MQVERKWHILLTFLLLLITSGQCVDNKEVKQERRALLDLILQVIRYRQQWNKHISRRCSGELFTSLQDLRLSPREKPLYVPRLDNSKLIEIVPRDLNMKHKFIQHFTAGPVKFSSECRTHFDRLYHNTRDCSRPAYYKRCARLLTRLAMSPLCAQS
ncbi:ALK and LTK ligand 1 isoform X1 [Syngnathus scovelli]|uniref:ALK and LTK ligand 1 isoform X1 n=1 Tax=Syngnathus scovelli TaxID=161590 RepID=UPI00211049C2|nr:ALK and LTK ligand 1 isoform X1 [Syngnathus scovelli]